MTIIDDGRLRRRVKACTASRIFWTRAKTSLWRWLDRQPLLTATACLLAGIVCGYRIDAPWVAMAAAALLCVCAAIFMRTPLWRIFVALCILLVGWTLATRDKAGRDDEAHRFRALAQPQTYVCRVGPEVTVQPLRGHAAKHTFRAEKLRTEDGTFACRHLPAEVTWFGAAEEATGTTPQPGEIWRIRGSGRVRKKTQRFAISGSQQRRGSRHPTGGDQSVGLARACCERPPYCVPARGDRHRDVGRHPGAESGDVRWQPPCDAACVAPRLCGFWHDPCLLHLRPAYRSGGHRAEPRRFCLRHPTYLLGLGERPLLIFYTALTGARPPAVRACLMALLYLAAPLIGRRPNALMALAGTALIVHALQPWLIFDIGCVLSFTVMGGLVAFCRPFCQAGQRLFRVARLTERANLSRAAGAKVHARRLNMLAHAVTWLSNSLAVSLAAWWRRFL